MKPKTLWTFLRICGYCSCALLALSPALWFGWKALIPGIGALGIVICLSEFTAWLPRP